MWTLGSRLSRVNRVENRSIFEKCLSRKMNLSQNHLKLDEYSCDRVGRNKFIFLFSKKMPTMTFDKNSKMFKTQIKALIYSHASFPRKFKLTSYSPLVFLRNFIIVSQRFHEISFEFHVISHIHSIWQCPWN